MKKSYRKNRQVKLTFTPEQMKVLRAMMFLDRKDTVEDWITSAVVSVVEGVGAYGGFNVWSTKQFLRLRFGKSLTHRDLIRFLAQYPQHTDHPQRLREHVAEVASQQNRNVTKP